MRSNPPLGIVRLPDPLIGPLMAAVVPVPGVENWPPFAPKVIPRLATSEAAAVKSNRPPFSVNWPGVTEAGGAPNGSAVVVIEMVP